MGRWPRLLPAPGRRKALWGCFRALLLYRSIGRERSLSHLRVAVSMYRPAGMSMRQIFPACRHFSARGWLTIIADIIMRGRRCFTAAIPRIAYSHCRTTPVRSPSVPVLI
jgi:hypothetical protein